MSNDVHQALDARFQEVDSLVEAIRGRYPVGGEQPTDDELASVASSGKLVDRFLADVDEALKQIFVAGLAFPDPELPEELATLSERAERHGLPTAVEHLIKLRVSLEAIIEERDLLVRQELSQKAWAQTQRFLAWLRLYRAEHDFLVVKGNLAAESTGEIEQRRVAYPARTMSVWPVGMELDASGRMVIFARDLDSDLVVLLRDQISEFDPEHPLQGRVISRLFQDSVSLPAVLSNIIRLEEHPVVTRARALLFRPAFQARPRVVKVADTFEPPALPEVPLDERGVPQPVRSAGPSRLRMIIGLSRGRLKTHTEAGGAFTVSAPSYALRFNLTKLLLREAEREMTLDAVVLPREDDLLLLSVPTIMDGTTFPTHDPALFRTAPGVLARRAESSRVELGAAHPATCAWLITAAYLLGGASGDDADEHAAGLLTLPLAGLDDHYLIGLSRFLMGQPYAPEGVLALVRDALVLAALADESELDLRLLAHVLGRDPEHTSPADLRLITGAMVYKALWLAMGAGLVHTLGLPLLQRVYDARYAGELKDPTPGDVCARALLMTFLYAPTFSGGTATGEESLSEMAEAMEQDDKITGPLTFLVAYTDELGEQGSGKRARPLPEFCELFWFGDTLALLTDGNRHGAPLMAISFSRERLVQSIADALLAWSVPAEGKASTDTELRQAADALLVMMAAGLGDLVVS